MHDLDPSAARPLLIGVIGSDDHPGEEISEAAISAAEEVGRIAAERGAIILSGGRGGVMKAVARGARRAGGVVVGFLPGLNHDDVNEFVTVPLPTGLGPIRNHLTVTASDAVIMIAGSTGTLNEATIAYGKKPLIVIEGTGGWSNRLRETLYEAAHFDLRGTAEIRFVRTAGEAVELAASAIDGARP